MTLRPTTIRLEEEILESLDVIRERDGISVSEQVRRALKQWIEQKGVAVKKAAPRRASTRRKA